MTQDRTESDMQNLARMEIVEQRREFAVGQAPRVRRPVNLGRNVIAGAVNRIAFTRESGYLAEEFRRDLGDGSLPFSALTSDRSSMS